MKTKPTTKKLRMIFDLRFLDSELNFLPMESKCFCLSQCFIGNLELTELHESKSSMPSSLVVNEFVFRNLSPACQKLINIIVICLMIKAGKKKLLVFFKFFNFFGQLLMRFFRKLKNVILLSFKFVLNYLYFLVQYICDFGKRLW